MRPAKGQDEEEDEEEEFVSKKEGPSNSKEPKINDQKANATRSKHSVTEQRRRSKINERFQILRDLIPHSDQKRDTASFLLEVIEYVQYLQEKVQKYEGSYQGWSGEPTKLMPWRNSHWRVQSFVGHPQAKKNGSGPALAVTGKFDENSISVNPAVHTNAQNLVEYDTACQAMDRQSELANKAIAMPAPLQANMPAPVQSDSFLASQRPVPDAQSTECSIRGDAVNQQDELMIEGGTISLSTLYSQGLLNNLAQALQSSGVDLTHASISVQIELGKRANRGLNHGASIARDHVNAPAIDQTMMHFKDASNGEDSDQAQKRLKT